MINLDQVKKHLRLFDEPDEESTMDLAQEWLERKAPDLARTVIALHAQLADAKAAQAMVVERAAEHIVSEGERLAEGIPNAGPGLEFLRELADEVRALADKDGDALVHSLRAERDALMEAVQANLLRPDNMRAALAIADRDRLAAANAALEAQVARLVRALEDLTGSLNYLKTQAKNGTLHPQVVIQNVDAALSAAGEATT